MPTDRAPAGQGSTANSGRKTAGDIVVTVSERLVSQICQLAVFVLAARLLGPGEFGTFAIVSACAILLLRLAEAGWAPFIMTRPDQDNTPYQVVMVALLSGSVFAAIGVAGTQVAKIAGLAPDLARLSMLFCLWIALATVFTAQKGVLIWRNQITTAALIEITSELVGGAITIVSLFQGAGLFALIYGRLGYQGVALFLSFSVTRRLPTWGIPAKVRQELWAFSFQILSSRMLYNVRLHFITLTLGAFLGPVAVGYFRVAERLVGAAFELVAVPGQLLAWTMLRRARDAGPSEKAAERIQQQVARHLKVLLAIGTPLFIWLSVMHSEIVAALLGPEWQPAGVLVAILALCPVLMLPGVLTEPLLSICGQTRRLPAFTAIIFAISVGATCVAAPLGVLPLAWTQLLVNSAIMVLTFRLFTRHTGIDVIHIAKSLQSIALPLILGSVILLLLQRIPIGAGWPALLREVVVGLVSGGGYVSALLLLDRPFWNQIAKFFRADRVRQGTAS
ncbi:oligosaccharide flippase family protein [Loktanella salsilacus]|uniref:oligosaccharide flippase family protein n=1 Tax=Loktanella salsilacus TaxID=195913 RepID=UPI003735EE8A